MSGASLGDGRRGVRGRRESAGRDGGGRLARLGRLAGLIAAVVAVVAVFTLCGEGRALGYSFSDVARGDPYYAAIMDLVGRGAVTGFTDGTFRPDERVSRQQFAKMIVKALGLAVTGSEVCPFGDVPAQEGADPLYPAKYVAVCAKNGIAAGITATIFAPRVEITRQQLMSMIARAAHAGEPPAAFSPEFASRSFSSLEHYQNARAAAYAWLLHGLMGMGSDYDFLAPATRGECAQLLYQLREESLPAGATLLFADDFSTKWAGRLEADQGTDSWRYDLDRGEYVCDIYTPKLQCRQAPDTEFADFTAEVEARCVGDGGYGLVFRITEGWDDFYEFIVFTRGYWQLWHRSGNEWSVLTKDLDNPSSAIEQGDAWNLLRVDAYGDQVTVSVNGVSLFGVEGARSSAGRIGFLAQAASPADGAEVAFDDYRVWSASGDVGR